MRRFFKTFVATTALLGLCTLSVPAHAKSPTHHPHKHSGPPKNPASNHYKFASNHSATKKSTGGPIFVPPKMSKAEQAKQIHDQRVKNAGGPIFTPTKMSKAEQAKQIHDQRVKDAGGPIFVPPKMSKAEQAKQIHDQRVKDAGGPIFTPTKMSKAEQAKQIHDERMRQQQGDWGGYGGRDDGYPGPRGGDWGGYGGRNDWGRYNNGYPTSIPQWMLQ